MNMMAGLIGTQRIHTFNTSLFIKGFSAMLVPAKRIRDLLVWHLIYNKSGNRISFLDNTIDPIETISISELEKARHIVGWCSETRYCAGKTYS